MVKFSEFLFGTKEKAKQLPTFTPGQQKLQEDLLGGLGGQQGLQQQGIDFLSLLLSQDPEALQQFQAPALRQFQEEIIPGITERFAGLGALNSSGFQQTLAQSGQKLAENLAQQRGGLGIQGLAGLQALQSQALSPQFQTGVSPRQPGFFEQVIGPLLQLGVQASTGGLF